MNEVLAWVILIGALAFAGRQLWDPPDETSGKAGNSTGHGGGGG